MGKAGGEDARGVRAVFGGGELLLALTAVRGAAQALTRQRGSLSDEQQAQLVEVVGDQSARAIAILRRTIAEARPGRE